MEFATIHDLSRELNVPARVVRYRFHQLRQAGKLVEGADFIREDYVDDQHFTWKINPLSYMRETATNVAPPPLGYQSDNDAGNKHAAAVNQRDTKVAEPVTRANEHGNQSPTENGSPSLEREMIEFMKAQIATKDEQIKDLSGQLKGINDLNIKLVGQNVHQSERIQELLKLSAAPAEPSPVAAKAGSHDKPFVNQVDNSDSEFVHTVDTKKTPTEFRDNDSGMNTDADEGTRAAA